MSYDSDISNKYPIGIEPSILPIFNTTNFKLFIEQSINNLHSDGMLFVPIVNTKTTMSQKYTNISSTGKFFKLYFISFPILRKFVSGSLWNSYILRYFNQEPSNFEDFF